MRWLKLLVLYVWYCYICLPIHRLVDSIKRRPHA